MQEIYQHFMKNHRGRLPNAVKGVFCQLNSEKLGPSRFDGAADIGILRALRWGHLPTTALVGA